ncbi:MAG: transglutaminase domain-containing protein [Deltaproteobacteria bacterium]
MKITRQSILRLAVILCWIVLFGALLQRDYLVRRLNVREAEILRQAASESWLGIYFNRQRIGFVHNIYGPKKGDTILLREEARINLNILGEMHPVEMKVSAHLDRGSLLQDFSFSLTSPFYHMQAKGEVQGDKVLFSLSTGKEMLHDSIRLASPPLLATNQRGYLLRQRPAVGEKVRVSYFDPVSLAAKESVLEYRGLEKILIKGRIHQLHHFVELFSGLRINSWLDEEGQVIKEESPAGFVFLREPKFRAIDIKGSPDELLRSVSVPLDGQLPPDRERRQAITYRISGLAALQEFALAGGRQQLKGGLLTVNRESAPGDCPGATGADLAATAYIQSRHPQIEKQRREITAGAATSAEKAHKLAAWVYNSLEKRPVIGIPDALATLDSRRGDCNEHAALFAALARNAGIPARIAAGVMFYEGAFYYHAWNEIWLDNRWVSIDTTNNQWPADLTHIRFVSGEVNEQVKISNLLGKLRIEVVRAGKE